MFDPIVAASGTGLVLSPIAGRALLFGARRLPERWHRMSVWLLIAGAAIAAGACTFLPQTPSTIAAFILLLGAVPGTAVYLASRTALASALVSLVPLYFGVGALTLGRPLHAPEIALDRLMPLEPAWMGVYGSLYIFVLLPWIVVRERALRRRAMQAYIAVLLVSYGGFILYPTIGPRPDRVLSDGFAASTLRLQYSLDWPYNCFPSLHVAESFVSALTCFRVHKAVGRIAVLWAALIAVSTVFTKQHYVVDAVAGAALAYAAYRLFLCRSDTTNDVPHTEQQLAPRRAAAAIAVFVLAFGCAWLADLLGFLPGPEQVVSLRSGQ